MSFEPFRPGLAVEADQEGFPFYVDAERRLYHHYGMLSAGFWDLWGPRTWWLYLRLLVAGRRLQQSTGDVHQRGGDVLIDPEGLVRFHYIGQGPADRPAVATLLALVP